MGKDVGGPGSGMFGCLTRRVGVILVALAYVILGLVAGASLVHDLFAGASVTQQHSLHAPCQFTGCDHHPLEEVTCSNLHATSWKLQQLVLALGGLAAGCAGISGMVDRDIGMLNCFYYFLLVQFTVYAGCFVADNAYVELCGRLPLSYWRTLQFCIPHRLQFVELMGLKPETLPPSVLDELVGLPTIKWTRLAQIVPLVVQLYVVLKVKAQCASLGQGPIGMGSAYGINFESETYDTFMEIRDGLTDGIRSVVKPDPTRHLPFSNLRAGEQEFPTAKQDAAAIKYSPQKGWCTNQPYNPLHARMYGTFADDAAVLHADALKD